MHEFDVNSSFFAQLPVEIVLQLIPKLKFIDVEKLLVTNKFAHAPIIVNRLWKEKCRILFPHEYNKIPSEMLDKINWKQKYDQIQLLQYCTLIPLKKFKPFTRKVQKIFTREEQIRFFHLVINGQLDPLRKELEKHDIQNVFSFLDSFRDVNGMTPTDRAVEKGHEEILQFFYDFTIEKQNDQYKKWDDILPGGRPLSEDMRAKLFLAIFFHRKKVIDELSEKINIDLLQDDREKRMKMISHGLAWPSDGFIHMAVENGFLHALEVFHKKCHDLFYYGEYLSSLLETATMAGHQAIVDYLKEKGATMTIEIEKEVEKKCNEKHALMRKQQIEAAVKRKFPLSYFQEIFDKSFDHEKDGPLFLYLAIYYKHEDLINYLINKEVKLFGPLDYVVKHALNDGSCLKNKNNREVIQWLIEKDDSLLDYTYRDKSLVDCMEEGKAPKEFVENIKNKTWERKTRLLKEGVSNMVSSFQQFVSSGIQFFQGAGSVPTTTNLPPVRTHDNTFSSSRPGSQ